MTDLTPRLGADALLVQDYTAEGFRIGGETYSGAVLVAAGRVHSIDVPDVKSLQLRHVDVLKGTDTGYLLLGGGARTVMPPIGLIQELRAMGIVTEAMSTGAACRTFNVLVAEGRQVAALLFPV